MYKSVRTGVPIGRVAKIPKSKPYVCSNERRNTIYLLKVWFTKDGIITLLFNIFINVVYLIWNVVTTSYAVHILRIFLTVQSKIN